MESQFVYAPQSRKSLRNKVMVVSELLQLLAQTRERRSWRAWRDSRVPLCQEGPLAPGEKMWHAFPEMCLVGCLWREQRAQLDAYDQIHSDKVFLRKSEIFWNINAAKVESWSFFMFYVEIHVGWQNAIVSLESKEI